MDEKQIKYPKKSLLIGILFTIAGCLLLFSSLGKLALTPIVLTILFTIAGVLLLYISIVKENNSIISVPGMMISLGGIFYLLLNSQLMESVTLGEIWPAYMMIAGISFIPYGLSNSSKKHKTVILIPAATIIFLSLLFLPFSLGLINMHFKDFVATWWPFIFIIVGITFMGSSLRDRKKEKKKNKSAPNSETETKEE